MSKKKIKKYSLRFRVSNPTGIMEKPHSFSMKRKLPLPFSSLLSLPPHTQLKQEVGWERGRGV